MLGGNIERLIGVATRFIPARNAIQTVYWRTSSEGRMYKYCKTCEIDKDEQLPKINRNLNKTYI